MGVRRLDRIASQLVAGGRPESEPVAIVQRGTFPDQRTVTGTLAGDDHVGSRSGWVDVEAGETVSIPVADVAVAAYR